ncbi:MAG: hypothetical protein ABIT83_18870 [Massilia sp.]
MNKRARISSIFIALALCAGVILSGCQEKKENVDKVSNDIAALRALVALDPAPGKARWEVFGTPEYTGGVPGPTDFVTLVAEIEPAGAKAAPLQPGAGTVWIAPEAPRPWLTAPFRELLAQHKNSTVALSALPHCQAFRTTLVKTGKAVEGFRCDQASGSLIYLTLSGAPSG